MSLCTDEPPNVSGHLILERRRYIFAFVSDASVQQNDGTNWLDSPERALAFSRSLFNDILLLASILRFLVLKTRSFSMSSIHLSCELQSVKNGSQQREIRPIFFFDKGENGAEIAKDVHGLDTVTANYLQFWFRRFRSGIPVVENVDKITEMVEVDRHVSIHSIL
ncbi:hypothetical protein TNCV_2588141 [Trichonephila clavipes]|nr:hypothetical protein TNCV_2588141 [Trichonephila clavipes]